MSGGFLDAFTWLSLGGVFASSQTGNVVFLGIVRHVRAMAAGRPPPASDCCLSRSARRSAIRIRAPLLCLAGEIVCLALMMLLLHRVPDMVAIPAISFGVALQSASFRQVERWKYLSVTVTGNMLRAIDQSVATSDRDAARSAGTMLLLCLMFLLGAAISGCVTMWLGAWSLALPIASSGCLWLCSFVPAALTIFGRRFGTGLFQEPDATGAR